MVDIPSSQPSTATTLASSAPTTQSSTPALSSIQVTIASLTQALEDLIRTIQTGATPVAPPDGNSLTLATALGNITILLPQLSAAEQQNLIQLLTQFAQAQRSLTLVIQPGSPPIQASLLIPTNTVQSSVSQPAQATSSPTTSQPIAPVTISTGESFPAIVLPPLTSSTAPSLPAFVSSLSQQIATAPNVVSQQASFEPLGQQLAPTIQQSSSKIPSIPQQPIQPSLISAASALASDANIGQNSVSPLSNLLQPGNEVSLRVTAVLSSSQTTLPPLSPNQIAATVVGTGTNGQLILKSGDITLFVKADVSAPIGTNIILTVETAKPPPLLTLPSFDPTNFPALPQIVAALAQIDPTLMQQMMATRIPQPTDALSGALLVLLSSFKPGNSRSWLGDEAADKLTLAGKQSLLASISHELGSSGQLTQDGTVGEWRSYPIPLYVQQHFQALTLYVHNDQRQQQSQEDNKSSGSKKVRFLIDMKLSKLGAMQIDGFVQSKKLDMILRSENLLPDGMHNDLRRSYIKALGAVGYAGALNFQVGRQHWMRMQRSSAQEIMT